MIRFAKTVLFAGLVMMASWAAAADIDLSSWTALTLDLPGGQSAGNWVLSDDNTTVTQTINADPSFFMNNLDQVEYAMDGHWQVVTSGDDDIIGFAFGYQDPAHCYIMDWKQNGQNISPYGNRPEGFRIIKIEAPDVSELTLFDFWDQSDTDYKTVLASNYGTTLGWADNTEYSFHLSFASGSFRVIVEDDETILWDVTVYDNTYTSGQFAFYNFSQAHVRYSGFTQNELPVCDAGGPYIGNVGQPVQFDGTDSHDPDGVIVSFEWDFGDGHTGSGPTPTHVYHDFGIYQLILCVTDNDGGTRCCSPDSPVAPSESVTWGSVKAKYK